MIAQEMQRRKQAAAAATTTGTGGATPTRDGSSKKIASTTATGGGTSAAVRGGDYSCDSEEERAEELRVCFQIIRNARIENVGKFQSCMVSKLRIIWKQTVLSLQPEPEPERGAHGRVGRGELLSFYCGRCAHHAQFWFDATALAMSQAEMWQCVARPALRAD